MFGKIGFSLLFAQVSFAALLSIESYWWIPCIGAGRFAWIRRCNHSHSKKTKNTPAFRTKASIVSSALLGGFANILKAELDGQRLKVVVKSVAARQSRRFAGDGRTRIVRFRESNQNDSWHPRRKRSSMPLSRKARSLIMTEGFVQNHISQLVFTPDRQP
ncbi:MAG: hypothetical protein MZU97_18480 [Bacillus subtilis]|nr:hypothetical protein [Bacillus subtilis]